jgi:predicted dehydrogenase
MNEVRIGFIGCGPRARSMMDTALTVKNLRVTAICDKYPILVQQGAEVLGDETVKTYTDHRQMLREAPIDAVYVIVEPENCADLVVDSLEAGKHALSEVPMAYSVEDCWRIVLAVEKSGLKYQLGEQMRHAPHIVAWKELADKGELGNIVYAEGEYLHGMDDDRYYLDPDSGERLTIEQAKQHPNPRKSRFWKLEHPILYLPHELSPLLRIMDDRVTSVVGMSSGTPSRRHEFYPFPDFEAALMQTAKGSLLNLRCGFTVHTIGREQLGYHWHRLIGTQGTVETNRSDADKMKWLRDVKSPGIPEEVWWGYDESTTSAEALASGHGGADYYPIHTFVQSILQDTTPELDVYKSAETAAPAILAAQSAELGGARIEVPDFRPNALRAMGQQPATTE